MKHLNHGSTKLVQSLAKFAVVASALFASTVYACCSRDVYDIPRIQESPKLDGKMNESVWQNAAQIELKYENNPGEGIPAPVKTVAYLYEDGKSLHVLIRAFDPEPEKIRGFLRDRDALWDDDNVGLIIDTFNDERSGYEFFVNPKGAQADMRMTDTNGWNEDPSWDAIWESAASIDDQGWIAELSIPFRALRFPDTDGELEWNIAMWRNYPRDVRHQMSNYKSDRNLECNLCQFDKAIGFSGVEQGKNFQLTPTMTAGRTDTRESIHNEETDTHQMSDWEKGDNDSDIGLNLRWGITQDMVLNATLNPDFSQIETDSAQLDVNNTYSLFYREKRPFFLDGADYFRSNNFNFVHTRNIADPDYGLKLTGKTGKHTYGVLVADDKNTTFLLPGNQGSDIAELETDSQVAVARYKMDIGERNNVGALITSRQADGYHNTLASIDGTHWFSQEASLQYNVAYSDSKNPTQLQEDNELAESQEDYAYAVNYSHSTRDYNWRVAYRDIGKDFRADMGFTSRADFRKLVVGGRRTYYGEDGDFFTRYGYFGDWDISYDQDGNKLEQEIEIHGNLQGQKQFFSNFGVVARERFYDDEFFDEIQFMAFAAFKPIKGLSVRGFTRFGDQIDFANTRLGDVLALETGMDYQFNDHFSIDISHNYNKLDVDGGNLFTANQTETRLAYQFNIQSLLKLVIQYTDIDRTIALYDEPEDYDTNSKYFSTQLIYSYKINPQTLFYLGYSDGGFQDDNYDSLQRDQRTVFAKFSYAWQR